MFYKEFQWIGGAQLWTVLGCPIAVHGSHYSTKLVHWTVETPNSSWFLSAETSERSN